MNQTNAVSTRCHELCPLPINVKADHLIGPKSHLRKRIIDGGIETRIIVEKQHGDGVNVPTDATACDSMAGVVRDVRQAEINGESSGSTTQCPFAPNNILWISAVKK